MYQAILIFIQTAQFQLFQAIFGAYLFIDIHG